MTARTSPDGMPYSLETDFGDVQQWYELAMAVDLRSWQVDRAFDKMYRPAAFLGRVSANFALGNGGSTFWSNLTADWNTSLGNLGTSAWSQNAGDPPSWWMIGANIQVSNTGGAPSTSDHVDGMFNTTTHDPVTGAATSGFSVGFQYNRETNSGGESLSLSMIANLYRGSVFPLYQEFGPGTGTRVMLAGSRFWGLRLGDVFS